VIRVNSSICFLDEGGKGAVMDGGIVLSVQNSDRIFKF